MTNKRYGARLNIRASSKGGVSRRGDPGKLPPSLNLLLLDSFWAIVPRNDGTANAFSRI